MRIVRLLRRITRFMRRPRELPSPEVIDELVMREATIADLKPLAELHVRTFNETHVGPFGSGPTYATREWQWREKLQEVDETNFVLVLESPTQELVGFIWCHPTNDNPEWDMRLNKIYLLRPYQRRGLGRRLLYASVSRLISHGKHSMALFTETDNEPACSFYDQIGGVRQLDEQGKFGGMYGFPDLTVLRDRLQALSA